MEEMPQYWKNLSLENIKYINPETEKEEIEEWRDVVGYEGLYQVSNCGRVKSLKRQVPTSNRNQVSFLVHEKIKPSFDCGKGYRRIEISKEGVNRKYFVHRLVALAFIPNPENKNDINHKFGVVWDNRVSQIEWSTESENAKHSYDVLGRKPSPSPWKGCNPKDHPMYGRKKELSPNWGKRGKLSPNYGKKYGQCKTSVPIICNETSERFESITHAASLLKISEGIISDILKGFNKTANGLTFRYEAHTRKKSPKAIDVFCITTGESFDSITDAALAYGLTPSKISLVISNKRNHTKGYKFKVNE